MPFTDQDFNKLLLCLKFHTGHPKAECFDEDDEDITFKVFKSLLLRLEAAEAVINSETNFEKQNELMQKWRESKGLP